MLRPKTAIESHCSRWPACALDVESGRQRRWKDDPLAVPRLDAPLTPGRQRGFEDNSGRRHNRFAVSCQRQVNSVLNNEENQILNGLLRVGSARHLVLSGEFSSGGSLSSTSENSKTTGMPPKTVRVCAKLDFDAKRHLLKFSESDPNIKKHFEGEFHVPLVVAYGANRQRGAKNLSNVDLDDPIASRLSGLTELYDVEQILSDLYFSSRENVSKGPESKHLERLKGALSRILPGGHKPSDI